MTATITIKDQQGRYKELQKQFTDDRHLSNYISYMYKKGWQVIGVEPGGNTLPFSDKEVDALTKKSQYWIENEDNLWK